MKAFITGSRRYGTPTADSDLDLVVFLTPVEVEELRKVADSDDREKVKNDSDAGPQWAGGSGASLRFGKMNLLCVTDPIAYAVWLAGTKQLSREADSVPVSRDLAVNFFEALRRATGLYTERPTIQDARRRVNRKQGKQTEEDDDICF